MGVPLPHLVLPLSGCLSGRTPTRATRGEARGHRSVLAQNPLLMHPSFFLSLDLSSVCCVLARWWIGLGVFALLWVHSCLVSPDGVTLWTCGSPKGTQHDGPGSVWCLCIALGVGVDRRRACPHRRDVRPWCTAGANGVATVLGTMVLRGCVCVAVAVAGPTMVTPDDRGGLGG